MRFGRLFLLGLCLASFAGCSSVRGRFVVGSLMGGLGSGGTAVLLSPNAESRALNALVFGLAGGLAGALLGVVTYTENSCLTSYPSLQERELKSSRTSSKSDDDHRFVYPVPTSNNLPEWLKTRVSQPVIEESIERPTLGEDGTLHQEHRTYRIKRQAELSPEPIRDAEAKGATKKE